MSLLVVIQIHLYVSVKATKLIVAIILIWIQIHLYVSVKVNKAYEEAKNNILFKYIYMFQLKNITQQMLQTCLRIQIHLYVSVKGN